MRKRNLEKLSLPQMLRRLLMKLKLRLKDSRELPLKMLSLQRSKLIMRELALPEKKLSLLPDLRLLEDSTSSTLSKPMLSHREKTHSKPSMSTLGPQVPPVSSGCR